VITRISTDSLTFRVPRGESFTIPLSVTDKDGNIVDLSAYTAIECVVWRPEDKQIFLVKDHDDTTTGGAGVYLYGDTYAWSGLALTALNQLQVYFDAADTTNLFEDMYKFDIRASTVIGSRTEQVTLATGTIVVQQSSQGANFTPPVAVPFGPTGPQGEAATIAVGTVDTVPSADPATVTNSGTTSEAVFDFEIPQGAAATIAVGTVTTVAPGESATVTNVGTDEEAIFDFEIPQGAAGSEANAIKYALVLG
jgi:hypothetical protein